MTTVVDKMDKLEPHTLLTGKQIQTHLRFLKSLQRIVIPPRNSTLSLYPKVLRNACTHTKKITLNVHSSIFHKTPRCEHSKCLSPDE